MKIGEQWQINSKSQFTISQKEKKKTTIKPCFEVNNGEIVAHMLYVDHIQSNEMFYYAQLYFNAGVGYVFLKRDR